MVTIHGYNYTIFFTYFSTPISLTHDTTVTPQQSVMVLIPANTATHYAMPCDLKVEQRFSKFEVTYWQTQSESYFIKLLRRTQLWMDGSRMGPWLQICFLLSNFKTALHSIVWCSANVGITTTVHCHDVTSLSCVKLSGTEKYSWLIIPAARLQQWNRHSLVKRFYCRRLFAALLSKLPYRTRIHSQLL